LEAEFSYIRSCISCFRISLLSDCATVLFSSIAQFCHLPWLKPAKPQEHFVLELGSLKHSDTQHIINLWDSLVGEISISIIFPGIFIHFLWFLSWNSIAKFMHVSLERSKRIRWKHGNSKYQMIISRDWSIKVFFFFFLFFKFISLAFKLAWCIRTWDHM